MGPELSVDGVKVAAQCVGVLPGFDVPAPPFSLTLKGKPSPSILR